MLGLVREIEEMGLKSAWLDGEIVVLGPTGSPDFNALQNAFDRGRGTEQIVYFLFDAPFFEGHDLRDVPQRLSIGTVVAHLGAVRFAYLTGPFRYSMDGREAAELMSLVRPTSVIPVHYEGWSHFKQDRPEAEPELAALGDVVHWAEPGESTLVVV
jgi:L-ascorbate metabolism protein UlaG (beta-lactamase superfamily)